MGSEFEFAVVAEDRPVILPRWIRLGLWRSKAELTWELFEDPAPRAGRFTAAVPLNPLDVAEAPLAFDIVSMPPVSLVANALLDGEHYRFGDGHCLPAGMQYRFN